MGDLAFISRSLSVTIDRVRDPARCTGTTRPTPIRYDLSTWAGQTVRLRIATAANQAPLRAGVDNVRLIPIER